MTNITTKSQKLALKLIIWLHCANKMYLCC